MTEYSIVIYYFYSDWLGVSEVTIDHCKEKFLGPKLTVYFSLSIHSNLEGKWTGTLYLFNKRATVVSLLRSVTFSSQRFLSWFTAAGLKSLLWSGHQNAIRNQVLQQTWCCISGFILCGSLDWCTHGPQLHKTTYGNSSPAACIAPSEMMRKNLSKCLPGALLSL